MRAYHENTSKERRLFNTLYSLAREGATIDFNGNRIKSGWAVAVAKGPVFPNLQSVEPFRVIGFIKDIEVKSKGLEVYLGVWHDPETSEVYFDAVEVSENKDIALTAARYRNEKAIYGIDKDELVYTNSKEARRVTLEFGVVDVDLLEAQIQALLTLNASLGDKESKLWGHVEGTYNLLANIRDYIDNNY